MIEFVLENRVDLQRILSVLIALGMWRWGGAPERIIALIFVGLFTLPLMALDLITDGSIMFSDQGYIVVAIDVLACIGFASVALYANRNYPLWIAGFQVVALAAHVVRVMVDSVSPLAYAMMVIGPSYFQLLLMLVGLFRHIMRKRKYGPYRDWRVPLNTIFKRKQAPDGLRRQL